MRLHDTLGGVTEGRLTLRWLDLAGNPYYVYKSPNLITHGYRDVVANLLAQNFPNVSTFEADQYRLYEVRFGTGNATPLRTQTGLNIPAQDAVAPLTSVAKSLTADGVVLTCKALLDYSITVDGDIQELGMFTQDGTMFARQLTPANPKHENNALEVTWEFQIR